ncbi:unnamed protein product [Schistosoma margrebowiei]|uniref:Uncharacterized protein n=1 Tax=Schistosoma margrebowiei TaxID=48269 RepID=A0A183N260_9TREM|nr:unnamed protein product [Schistosoma margrebowiei]
MITSTFEKKAWNTMDSHAKQRETDPSQSETSMRRCKKTSLPDDNIFQSFHSHFENHRIGYFIQIYTLAALLLYIMFSTALPIIDDLVYTIRNNWNVINLNVTDWNISNSTGFYFTMIQSYSFISSQAIKRVSIL